MPIVFYPTVYYCHYFCLTLLMLLLFYYCHHYKTVATDKPLRASLFPGAAELTTHLLRLINILWLPLCRINKFGFYFPQKLLRSPILVGHQWLQGLFPVLVGCRNRYFYPRTLSATAVAMRNFIYENADSFRVFASDDFYRRRGDVRGHQGAHTRWWHGHGWTRDTRRCGHLLALLRLYFGLRLVSGKIGTSGFVFCPILRIFPM
jgi:hypothetical protein